MFWSVLKFYIPKSNHHYPSTSGNNQMSHFQTIHQYRTLQRQKQNSHRVPVPELKWEMTRQDKTRQDNV